MIKYNIQNFPGNNIHIVDVMPFLHASYNNRFMGDLSCEVDGEVIPTKALFGLMRLFRDYMPKDTYVFCFDSKHNNRRDDNTEYKSNRPKAKDDLILQINLAKEILYASGFSVYQQDGIEADDFIVYLANKYKSEYDNVFVRSLDSDLASTVDENVYFINVRGKSSDISMENFEEVLNCPYNSILLKKALVGDPSDNIKGIPRFGPAKFLDFMEYLKQFVDPHIIRHESLERQIIYTTPYFNDEERAIALDGLSLVLPLIPDSFPTIEPDNQPDIQKLKYFLERYKMFSIINKMSV